MAKLVLANDPTAAHRRAYLDIRAADGISPALSESGGQPQVSIDGAAWTNAGIGTLTAIGNGRYYADLAQSAVATAGSAIETRYKSAGTAETPGDSFQVVAFDPNDAQRLGVGALPASGSLPINPVLDPTQNFNNGGQSSPLPGNILQVLNNPASATVSGLLDVNAVDVAGAPAKSSDGTVAAATASTITLDAADTLAPNLQPNTQLMIVSGPGAGNIVTLASLVSGRQWNISPNWAGTQPTTSSTYQYVGTLSGAGSAPTVVQIRQEMDANSTKLANLDAAISSRPTAAQIATAFLTDVTASDFTTVGSPGYILKNGLPAIDGSGRVAIQVGTGAGQLSTSAGKVQATLADADSPALLKLATAMAADGAGGYQFTVTALANAPTGSGGGASDWSTTERAQIRYRLGLDGVTDTPAAAPTFPATLTPAYDAAKTAARAGDPMTLADGAITSAKFTVASYPGVASGLVEKIDQLWRRFFKPTAVARSGQAVTLRTLADDGATPQTTQAGTDDGQGNQTLGAAS